MTLEQAWGFEVRKYDPCWPPFAEEPEGRFDLVLCTHTASLIPQVDLEWFLRRLFNFADKAVFIAEKIGERKKAEVADTAERAINWSPQQWIGRIGQIAGYYPAVETVLSLRVRESRGAIMTRHVWRDGGYAGAFEAGQPD
jgi:hypothetical protein